MFVIGTGFLAIHLLASSASAYYSPQLGRFLSRDPVAETGHVLIRSAAQGTAFIPRDMMEPEELHAYAYVMNSPLNRIDPDGLKSRVSVNSKTCKINVTLNIGIYGKKASSTLASRIMRCIEQHWKGLTTQKGCKSTDPGCCGVVVAANTKYYSSASHWWDVNEDNQIKFDGKTNRSWVSGFSRSHGHWNHNASCWTFAHEAGHLMGLGDDYSDNASGHVGAGPRACRAYDG